MCADVSVGCEGPSTSKVFDDPDFPALVKTGSGFDQNIGKTSLLPAYHHSKITKCVEIPFDVSKQKDNDAHMNIAVNDVQNTLCSQIARETGVDITLNRSKRQTLAIISGSPRGVERAEQLIIAKLRQQETRKITVPQEYHGVLIGKRGERLRGIQSSTLTRITIPSSNSADPNTITITGPPHGVTEAENLIKKTVDKQMHTAFERLDIPKIYHPFICGPNNKNVDELRKRTDTHINIPPPMVAASTITITGKRDDVAHVVNEIQAIHEQAKTYKTISVNVKKSQHHLVSGPRGSGLSEILAATGVSVEIPMDSSSEEVVLRGRPEDMGRALSMVYERAVSSVTETVRAPNRLHKLLIGKRGSAIAELREGYEKVNVEFGDHQDSILVRGPPEEVAAIVRRLEARVAELEARLAVETIRVDPKYFRHIIGRQGATVLRLCENNVQIHLPTTGRNQSTAPDEIVIEGDPAGIKKVKSEIEELVHKLENEKSKDVIIDPSLQQLLRSGYSGNPAPIRQIYDAYPKVTVVWPTIDENSHDPTESVVQLRGDRQQVDAAAEKLSKLMKQVMEENFRQEIRIFDEFRPHIIGRGSLKIKKLLEETNTRIQHPNPHSDTPDLFTIIGREANVQQAIRQIEELQVKLANVKELNVTIPSALTTRFVGNQAPSVRFILDQCPGVHIRFVNARQKHARKTGHDEAVMIGPQEALDKAKQLIDQMNSKVAELCAEEIVHVDRKFHGYLIGRQAANLTRFRDRHHVELIFPDRLETDPKLACEVRIVGTKDSVTKAKAELEKLIKSIEDEIEQSVPVNTELLHEVVNYRRQFPQPELRDVRVIMTKATTKESDGDSTNSHIRLIGQKASVLAAVEALQSMIADIESRVTRDFPITDPVQFAALDRIRSQFRAIERENRVLINLRRLQAPEVAAEQSSDATSQPCGILTITGSPERVELVYEEKIIPLLPVEEQFPVPKQFHRLLITVPTTTTRNPAPRGKQNATVNGPQEDAETQSKAVELRQKYGVNIRLPSQQDLDANFVQLRGTPAQLSAAKLELADWLQDCERRNYSTSMEVPSRFIRALTALRPTLVAKHDVRIRFGPDLTASPPEGDESSPVADEEQEEEEEVRSDESATPPQESVDACVEERVAMLTLHGYPERVAAAKRELEATVEKLKRQTTEELYIPAEVHSHLIGSRGSAIQRVMHEFKVRIEFPNRQARESGNQNAVLVTGDPDDVDRACDFLIAKANDLMDRFGSEVQHTVQRDQFRVELLPPSTATATGP